MEAFTQAEDSSRSSSSLYPSLHRQSSAAVDPVWPVVEAWSLHGRHKDKAVAEGRELYVFSGQAASVAPPRQ